MECTDMERRILDMWPKFEDGEYVWIGDDVSGMDVRSFVFTESCVMVTNLTSVPAYGECRKYGEPFKRPAPKVLDADGVEIKVGDTVWHHSGFAHGVVTSIDASSLISTVRYSNGYAEFRDAAKDLTHVQPDSWERLEKDARQLDINLNDTTDDYPRMNFARDLIRRAKALAEKEAAR